MNSISNILEDRNPSTAIAEAKEKLSIATATEGDKLSSTQADDTIKQVRDLIDPSWEAYFYKRLYALGKAEFLRHAVKARKFGKDPKRLFAHLVKP